jgi:hypothetical protein
VDSISKRKRSTSTKLSGHELYTLLAAGFLAGGSRQEKASVRLPCSGKKLAANAAGVCGRAVSIDETNFET